jgi:hypothetical protein
MSHESYSQEPPFEFEHLEEPYSGRELLQAIWTRPRYVMRYLLYYEQEKYVLPLLLLSGIMQSFERAADKHLGDSFGLLGVVLLALVLGPLGGLFTAFIGSWLLRLTGNWLGGKAESYQLRIALAWSSVPFVAILLLLPLEMLLFGNEIFQSDQPAIDASPVLVELFSSIKAVLAVWTMVLFVSTISEVQEFSVGKAILNFLLMIIVVAVPILVLVLLGMAFR